MTSAQLIALRERIADLDTYLIVRKGDYSEYTQEDHTKALAFRLLASAAVEHYVEERCVAAAKVGCERLKRSQPTIAGRALITWYVARNLTRALPAYETDPLANVDLVDEVLAAFSKSARDSHGIDGKSFRRLALPVGLRDSQISTTLIDLLDALANVRNPASHTYVNRARSLSPPEDEVRTLQQLITELEAFDAAVDVVSLTFPNPSP